MKRTKKDIKKKIVFSINLYFFKMSFTKEWAE